MTNHYQLLAKLKGHKNNDPPSICYVPMSNCLISGEKVYQKDNHLANDGPKMDNKDPEQAPTYLALKSKMGSYEKFSKKAALNPSKFEIIVWNL